MPEGKQLDIDIIVKEAKDFIDFESINAERLPNGRSLIKVVSKPPKGAEELKSQIKLSSRHKAKWFVKKGGEGKSLSMCLEAVVMSNAMREGLKDTEKYEIIPKQRIITSNNNFYIASKEIGSESLYDFFAKQMSLFSPNDLVFMFDLRILELQNEYKVYKKTNSAKDGYEDMEKSVLEQIEAFQRIRSEISKHTDPDKRIKKDDLMRELHIPKVYQQKLKETIFDRMLEEYKLERIQCSLLIKRLKDEHSELFKELYRYLHVAYHYDNKDCHSNNIRIRYDEKNKPHICGIDFELIICYNHTERWLSDCAKLCSAKEKDDILNNLELKPLDIYTTVDNLVKKGVIKNSVIASFIEKARDNQVELPAQVKIRKSYSDNILMSERRNKTIYAALVVVGSLLIASTVTVALVPELITFTLIAVFLMSIIYLLDMLLENLKTIKSNRELIVGKDKDIKRLQNEAENYKTSKLGV